MKCRNCKKDFHYCPSCGHYPEAELGYCSNLCVTQGMSKLTKEDKIKLLAEFVLLEDSYVIDKFKDFIKENKEEFGRRIVDYILEYN